VLPVASNAIFGRVVTLIIPREPYAHLTERLLDEPAGWLSGRFSMGR
jgi:hypothetical protein